MLTRHRPAETTAQLSAASAVPSGLDAGWFGPKANAEALEAFGMRLHGGGPHQSKTMMLHELEALLATGLSEGDRLRTAAVDENAMGKPTKSTSKQTFGQLAALYGLIDQRPLTKSLLKLWHADLAGHPLQALLIALARDPLLRETAPVVTEGVAGQRLQRPLFEAALGMRFPGRFSDKMLRSLAQNCASTWTQSGHLEGAIRKVRCRVAATPATVALAALIASVAGFGGPGILASAWMKVLDLSPDQALDQLRRAEAIGLARVRSAGDVIEISVRQPMTATLGVPELEHI